MPNITVTVPVTDLELANFLKRLSGGDGREINVSTSSEDEETVNTEAPETDKNNVAWDARFHASTKAVNADGSWKRKRGLSDAEKAEADVYDATGNAPVAAPPTPVTEPVAPVVAPPAPVPTPVAPAMPRMPGLPVAAPAPTPISYEEVVALFQTLSAEQQGKWQEIYAEAEITDPNALQTDGELRLKLAAAINKRK